MMRAASILALATLVVAKPEQVSGKIWAQASTCPSSGLSSALRPIFQPQRVRTRLLTAAFFLCIMQVHISLTGRTAEMGVDFVTSAGSHGLMVKFGTSSGTLTSSAPATSTPFTGAGWTATMNYAFMTGLAPATTYYYQVGSDAEGWSQIFSYVNQPETVSPPVFAVFADFGFGNDVSMSDIIADAAAGGFDMILHAGESSLSEFCSDTAGSVSFRGVTRPSCRCLCRRAATDYTLSNLACCLDPSVVLILS